MKQRISDILILLALLLLLTSHSTISTSARHLLPPHHQGDEEVKANQKIGSHAGSSTETKENDLYNLMGFEEVCEEVDEACLKRRMIGEANLDYIYTQHHHKDKTTTTSP